MSAGPVQCCLFLLSFFFLIVTSVSSGCFYLLIFTAHNSLCGGSRSAACLTPALISISFLSVWLLLLSCIKVHTMTSEVCDMKTVTAFLLMKFLLINCCCINYLLLMWIQTRKSKLYNIISSLYFWTVSVQYFSDKGYGLFRIPQRPKFCHVSTQFALNLPSVCHPDRWLQGSGLRAHTGTAGWGERLEAGSQTRPYRRHIHAPSTLFYLEEDARRSDMRLLILKKGQVRGVERQDLHSCLKVKYSVRCRHSWLPLRRNRVLGWLIFRAHKYSTHCRETNTHTNTRWWGMSHQPFYFSQMLKTSHMVFKCQWIQLWCFSWFLSHCFPNWKPGCLYICNITLAHHIIWKIVISEVCMKWKYVWK